MNEYTEASKGRRTERQGTGRSQTLTVGKGRAGSRVTGLKELTGWFGKQSFSPGTLIREGPAGSRTAERSEARCKGPHPSEQLPSTQGHRAQHPRLPENEADEEKRRPEAPLFTVCPLRHTNLSATGGKGQSPSGHGDKRTQRQPTDGRGHGRTDG